LAYEQNVTTTDLGFLLAGKEAVYHVSDHPEDTHVRLGITDADSKARRGWVEATKIAACGDYIGGYRFPTSAGRAAINHYGDVGEVELIGALMRAGVEQASFQTEQELAKADVLNQAREESNP
jgi:hypothetical protein